MERDGSMDEPRSRRAVLGAAAAGAVALTAGRLIGADPVAAGTGTMLYGTSNDSGANETQLGAYRSGNALLVSNYGGTGIFGQGDGAGGSGVTGFTNQQNGVSGYAYLDGTGVFAKSNTGYGLKVEGKVAFSRSGRVSVAKKTSSVKVDIPGVTTSSKVIATIQTNRKGYYVQAAVAFTGKIRIYLNKTVPAATKVAYFIID